MNKLVLCLLAASVLSIHANAWAIPDDVPFAVDIPDGPLTPPPTAGVGPGFGPFGSISFELDSVAASSAALGCRYYYEWLAPAGIAVADGFVVELATHGAANCFANSAAPVPVIPVVTTVTLDATMTSVYSPSGFNKFLQYVPVCELVLGESITPGGATLQGVIGFGPSIAPVATEYDSLELDAD
jgi:hypothetical protein